MAFIVDDDRIVRDHERGLALIFRGSEKEGHHEFVLSAPGLQVYFRGRRVAERVEEADPELPAPLRTIVRWRLALPRSQTLATGWTRESVEQAITEAMYAWKFAFGDPPGQLVSVEFE